MGAPGVRAQGERRIGVAVAPAHGHQQPEYGWDKQREDLQERA